MRTAWSNFAAAVVGGVVVATGFLALGITGRRTTQTIVDEAPAAAQPMRGAADALTPHAIYLRDAPGVAYIKALVTAPVDTPFDVAPQRGSTTSTGSGFLVDRYGDVLTNYHVIEGADPQTGIWVQFGDAGTRHAVLVAADQDDDLAVLRVDLRGVSRDVRPLALGDSTSVRVGDPTLALGNPFGLDRTLAAGIVSALQREIQAPDGVAVANVIQTDTPVDPGASGGPLLDALGRVIGINSQIFTGDGDTDGSAEGIAFAVPINTAKLLLPRLRRQAPATDAYLGVRLVSAPASGAAGRETGVSVDVQPGGPAQRAGLRDADRIEMVAGRAVGRIAQIKAIVTARMPGVTVPVTVRRGRRVRTLRVVLGAVPVVRASRATAATS